MSKREVYPEGVTPPGEYNLGRYQVIGNAFDYDLVDMHTETHYGHKIVFTSKSQKEIWAECDRRNVEHLAQQRAEKAAQRKD